MSREVARGLGASDGTTGACEGSGLATTASSGVVVEVGGTVRVSAVQATLIVTTATATAPQTASHGFPEPARTRVGSRSYRPSSGSSDIGGPPQSPGHGWVA